MRKNNFKSSAFTLVELIVVITILSVLSTIGFISFQGYGIHSRDAVRISDMRSIEKGFSTKLSKAEKLPIPDDKIDITASGTLLTYQGYAGTGTLGSVGVHGGGRDPVDGTFYTYSTNPTRNKYQLLGFFESEQNISLSQQSYANGNDRYPKVKGGELGIILNLTTNKPIQEENNNIDIVHTSNEYNFIIHNNLEGSFTGSGSSIINKWSDGLNVSSCKQILDRFSSEYLKNENYPIISNTGQEIEVFCDMKNGGYTGLFSVSPTGNTWKYNSSQWTIPVINGSNFMNEETTFDSYGALNTNEIKICRGDLEHCYTMTHNKNIPLQQFYTDNITHIEFSHFNYNHDRAPNDVHNINHPENINGNQSALFYSQLGLIEPDNSSYNKLGAGINIFNFNKLGFQADNNNVWPSFDNRGDGIGNYRVWDCGQNLGQYNYSSIALSIGLSGQCTHISPDTVMWYVLGK